MSKIKWTENEYGDSVSCGDICKVVSNVSWNGPNCDKPEDFFLAYILDIGADEYRQVGPTYKSIQNAKARSIREFKAMQTKMKILLEMGE